MQNYKASKADWDKIAIRANQILREREMTPKSLAELTGINYFAARRILIKGIESQTANSVEVCIKLGLIDKSANLQNLCLIDVQQVLNECWGGDSAQAELLIKLIRSTANLNISYKDKRIKS